MLTGGASFVLEYAELAADTAKARAALQLNEDKLEDFSKWAEGVVRLVRVILDEADKLAQVLPSLDDQIRRFTVFEEAFDVGRTLGTFMTVSSLLRNTESSNAKLVDSLNERVLVPLQTYFQDDVRRLKDSRRSYERSLDRYDSLLARYHSLSKVKESYAEDETQLQEGRILFLESVLEHAAQINGFKRTIDLLFQERMVIVMEELNDFFTSLAENFGSVHTQMASIKDQAEQRKRQALHAAERDQSDRALLIDQIKRGQVGALTLISKSSIQGHLMMRRKKSTLSVSPWRRVFARIAEGIFAYEVAGRQRGVVEHSERISLMLSEVRPLDWNDRRFCFEIYTSQSSQLFQAETEADMMEWIATFQAAKDDLLSGRQVMERIPSNRRDTSPIEQPSPDDSVSKKAAFLREWDNDLRRHFKGLGSEECALCSFPASLHTDMWTQGRVLVTPTALYFYSSLFGIGTKISVALRDVLNIDVVPTKFVTVIKFTLAGDAKDDLILKAFNSVDDSTTRSIEQLIQLHRNTQSAEPRSARQLLLDLHRDSLKSPEMDAGEMREQSPQLANVGSILMDPIDSVAIAPGQISNRASPTQGSRTDLAIASPRRAPETDDDSFGETGCGCTSHMDKRGVNAVIPIDCAVAFELMFGPACPVEHSVHAARRNRSFKIGDWKQGKDGNEERTETYLFPINNPLVRIKETECIVTLRLTKSIPGRCYVVDGEARTPKMMYADSFYTRTRYCITRAGPDQTRISICLGIVWIKSPFVKSIIRSAALKTFTEFCEAYMACLRTEIAAKVGGGALIEGGSDARITGGSGHDSLVLDNAREPRTASDDTAPDKDTGYLLSWLGPLLSLFGPANQTQRLLALLMPLLVATFAIGWAAGSGRSARRIPSFTAHDLETEVLQSLNIGRWHASSAWLSPRLKHSHARLQALHEDFATLRRGLWRSAQRLNRLERLVYRAEVAAALGDRLLKCQQQGPHSPDCQLLLGQWKRALHDIPQT